MLEIKTDRRDKKQKEEEPKIEDEKKDLNLSTGRALHLEDMFSELKEKGICIGKSYMQTSSKYNTYFNPDSPKTLNYSIAITGASGSGKTRVAVATIIKGLQLLRKKIIILDVQGDMHVSGETLYKQTRRNNPFSVNFFMFTKDIENGGPLSNVNLIIELFTNSVMERGIGPVQKTVLKQLLIDCYKAKGILDEDESTWNRELPTPKFFEEFTQNLMGDGVARKINEGNMHLAECLSIKQKIKIAISSHRIMLWSHKLDTY